MNLQKKMRTPESSLSIRFFGADGSFVDYGVVSRRCITDAFVEMLVDTLQSADATFSDFKYHDSGEGFTAEDATDTALETPCAEARDAGTQTEGATANIYRSVATHTYAGAFSITEHGLFNAATVGILLDRSVFTAKAVGIGDKLEFTYEVIFPSGS